MLSSPQDPEEKDQLFCSFWTVADSSSPGVRPRASKILGITQIIRSFALRVGRTRPRPTGSVATVWMPQPTWLHLPSINRSHHENTVSVNVTNLRPVHGMPGDSSHDRRVVFKGHARPCRHGRDDEIWRPPDPGLLLLAQFTVSHCHTLPTPALFLPVSLYLRSFCYKFSSLLF